MLDGTQTRQLAEIKTEDGKKEKHFLYYDGESVSGMYNIVHIFLWFIIHIRSVRDVCYELLACTCK